MSNKITSPGFNPSTISDAFSRLRQKTPAENATVRAVPASEVDLVKVQESISAAEKLREKVQKAVDVVQHAVSLRQTGVEFQMQQPDNRLVVMVRDKETNEVVRQIPSEEMLSIARSIEDGLDPARTSVFVKGKA